MARVWGYSVLAVLLIWGSPGWAALSLVSATMDTNTDLSIASIVVQANDLIIFAWSGNQGSNGTSAGSVTDNASGGSNVYAEAVRHTIPVPPAGTSSACHIHYAIAKASETLTITGSPPASEVDNKALVHVVRGANVQGNIVLDQANGAHDTVNATTHTSASITTTNANDYLFVLWHDGNTAPTYTENGTGFTEQLEDSVHSFAAYDRIVSAAGTYNDSVTSSVSTMLSNCIASFKESPATPVGCRLLQDGTSKRLAQNGTDGRLLQGGSGSACIAGGGATVVPAQMLLGVGL